MKLLRAQNSQAEKVRLLQEGLHTAAPTERRAIQKDIRVFMKEVRNLDRAIGEYKANYFPNSEA
jgi:hypothetical protein